jgi:hypothetical protein
MRLAGLGAAWLRRPDAPQSGPTASCRAKELSGGSAIEKRLDRALPPGWRYGKEQRDGQAVMKAWAPHRDPETTTPDYICLVVPDEKARGGVPVVRVDEGTQ